MDENRSSQCSQRELDALLHARVIYLATVRKDGNQSKAARLWFTTTSDRTILIQSGHGAWHTQRIRRGSPVIVWIGSLRGFAFIGTAELSDDPRVIEQIVKDFRRKYLMARLGFHRPTTSSFERGDRLAIKVTLCRVLPDGFMSQPGAPAPSVAGAAEVD
ncbi:MAG: pyridoxamine 5'-phosphate oxidase family protein [Deltaproteobacteria bacterium]|nr:pyridoxamine 5'-phosphate oxidase family protein [Deltaproteobacteria bacterium]